LGLATCRAIRPTGRRATCTLWQLNRELGVEQVSGIDLLLELLQARPGFIVVVVLADGGVANLGIAEAPPQHANFLRAGIIRQQVLHPLLESFGVLLAPFLVEAVEHDADRYIAMTDRVQRR